MLTKEQRADLAETLASPWGAVALICDGRRVDLQVQRERGPSITYRVMTYIDGKFRGSWCKGDTPEAKFLRKRVAPLTSPARRKEAEKALGKRWVAKQPFYTATHTFWHPDWPNGKAAINHLCKACESVEIAPEAAAP
jgi:hypothetical protein